MVTRPALAGRRGAGGVRRLRALGTDPVQHLGHHAHPHGTFVTAGRAAPRRLDHASIFLLIAGSYTPFALLLLDGSSRVVLLCVAWVGAGLGMAFRVLWTEGPAGCPAVYLRDRLGLGVLLPAVRRARQRRRRHCSWLPAGCCTPSAASSTACGARTRSPRWFGYHEVFHALTIVAFAAHYTGIFLATYALR